MIFVGRWIEICEISHAPKFLGLAEWTIDDSGGQNNNVLFNYLPTSIPLYAKKPNFKSLTIYTEKLPSPQKQIH